VQSTGDRLISTPASLDMDPKLTHVIKGNTIIGADPTGAAIKLVRIGTNDGGYYPRVVIEDNYINAPFAMFAHDAFISDLSIHRNTIIMPDDASSKFLADTDRRTTKVGRLSFADNRISSKNSYFHFGRIP